MANICSQVENEKGTLLGCRRQGTGVNKSIFRDEDGNIKTRHLSVQIELLCRLSFSVSAHFWAKMLHFKNPVHHWRHTKVVVGKRDAWFVFILHLWSLSKVINLCGANGEF